MTPRVIRHECLHFTFLLCLILPAIAVTAETPADLQGVLCRPIIGPKLSMEEAGTFAAARVKRMPNVTQAAQWEEEANAIRQGVLAKVVFRGVAAAWRDAVCKVEWQDTIEGGPGYHIRKLRYEALPGLWIPALLYEPDKLEGKVPVILNVNGHDPVGKAAPYKQMRCINQAKRGMIALNVEWLYMGQLHKDNYNHTRMNQIDLCGTSGLAPFYLSMKRGLDILLAQEHADPTRTAVMGLSGGGWQTIFFSSLDPRVTFANPVAGYSSFLTRIENLSDMGDSEQTPVDLAMIADYTHLTAMRAPRPTLLTFNSKDNCCFAAGHALQPLLDAALPIYKLYGKEKNLRSHVNEVPGTHNFEQDNREAMYQMMGDFFAADQPGYDFHEIPSEAELKTADQLQVALPADNADFNSLALKLASSLPIKSNLPKKKERATKWQEKKRTQLTDILRAEKYDATGEKVGSEENQGTRAAFWKLKVGKDWTVPGVELSRGEPKSTVIFLTNVGRTGGVAETEAFLAKGCRVLAVDPFYIGESKIAERDNLFALLVSSVGARPLGVQASQLAAIARWAAKKFAGAPVTIHAMGARVSLAALAAGALEDQAISRVELHGSFGSLKEIIEKNMTVDATPELFCMGLLHDFDIKLMAALFAPRPVVFEDAGERLHAELGDLKSWYALLGKDFQPLQ